MAVKQISKSSKAIIATPDTTSSSAQHDLKKAGLYTINDKGEIDLNTREATFLINPTFLEDNKSSNWVQHSVPGQSDPILQWVSSGARTVTFEALVTNDTSYFDIPESSITSEAQSSIADIASKFFKVSVPPTRNVPQQGKSLDISERLDYYRSLLYPEYNKNGELNKSPPLLVLMAGSAISNLATLTRITNNHDVFVLSDLKIKVTKQLTNLAPMEATVQFTLIRYNMRSHSRSRYLKY